MAHNIETMAYTNERPWHGLGTQVDNKQTVEQMMKASKTNWQVERRPIFDARGNEIEGFASLTRDSDNSVLDIVGSRYIPTQNVEAFSMFRKFVEAGDAHIETMGSLQSGKYVWALANLNKDFKVTSKDVLKNYLLAAVPHQQGKSVIYKFTNVRVVCNNTFSAALAGRADIRLGHRMKTDEVRIEKAKEALGIVREQAEEFGIAAQQLRKKSMRFEDTVRVLAEIYQDNIPVTELIADFDERANRTMKVLMDVNTNAPGAEPDNAYGVLNAVTYYADHLASRTADKRLLNAWLGKAARQKEAVMKVLIDA
jgi:phage/plasmid-like protein (TIGR03299 family)